MIHPHTFESEPDRTKRLRSDFEQRFGDLLGDIPKRRKRLELRKEMQVYDQVLLIRSKHGQSNKDNT